MKKFENVKKSSNPKVLAMLSGGKDSVTSIIMLKKAEIDVDAIHFVHKWNSEIPTVEAKRICKEYEIPLTVKDFTDEFCNGVNGFRAGRPCLLCKKQMYKVLLEYLKDKQYGWLCIGDNADDRTTIARIKQYIANESTAGDTLVCSGYFGSEMGIKLPKGMKVIRPLIDISADEAERILEEEGICLKRIGSTGDKYFEYHREGCPIQFADIGVELTPNLCEELKKYNDVITKYAREKGILASIHMPSTFIITIPKGNEEEAASYLEKHGLSVNRKINSPTSGETRSLVGFIQTLSMDIFETKSYEKMFGRFLERLELFGSNMSIFQLEHQIFCVYRDATTLFTMHLDFDNQNATIKYDYCENSTGRKGKDIFDNLILELFRTRKYKVISI